MTYRRLFIILSFIQLLSPVVLHAQLSLEQIIEKYYSSVVKIVIVDSIKNTLSRGTGFIVTSDGAIFTNHHVVGSSEWGDEDESYGKIYAQVMRKNGKISSPSDYELYLCKIEYYSKEEDFDGAYLRIVSTADGKPVTRKFSPIQIGNSDALKTGNDLFVLGYPDQGEIDRGITAVFNAPLFVTKGIVSGFKPGFVITDARITPGNSGGPVIDKNGKVIGLATRYYPQTLIGLIGGINNMYYIAKDIRTAIGILKPADLTFSFQAYQATKRVPPRTNSTMDMAGGKGGLSLGGTDKGPGLSKEKETPNAPKSKDPVFVTGLVKNSDSGKPISGAYVGLGIMKSGKWEYIAGAKSGIDGSFTMFPSITPGNYLFRATCEGFEDVVDVELDIYKGNYDELSIKLTKR
ncbi:MAG: trypsin-like peptidase domain-containing protein [Bacteroidia bacterium]|nr:trypsin-like peptidase domain-containing protein [Bacteroidia bacterium]